MKSFSSNSRRKRIGAMCTLLLATQLTACGGGDDNDPAPVTPPPTGNTPPPPPPPEPAKANLTLSGRVTDAPIANAVVTATVGDEIFTANADANGDYTLEIEIEETDVGAFVTLNARGVGEQAFVEFTSLAGSFQSLAAQAGDDDTLSNDENFSTQITNVSTAEAVLLTEANGGLPVTTDALRQSLGTAINGQDVLDLATAIKLAVDDAANYPLPEGQTSILELASNATARQAFINEVYEQDPDNFSAAQTAIAADPTLSQPLTMADVPSDLTAAMLSTDVGFSFNYSNRVSSYTFEQDGAGFSTGGSFDQAMTWAIEGSTIRVTFTQPIETVSYDTENCDGTVRQVEAHYTSEGVTLSLLNARMLATTETSSITYADCPSLAAREVTQTSARTILSLEDFQAIDAAELAGATQTIYVYDSAQGAVVADVADLGDGTGVTQQTGLTFTWQLDSTGRIIEATFEDGSTAEYLSFGDVDEVTSDILYEIRTAGGARYVDAGASVFVEPDAFLDLTAADVPGRFYQFGIGNEASPDPLLKGFRMRFDADGRGAQEDDYLDDAGNLVTTNETTSQFNGFRWTLDDGDVTVRRTFDSTGGPANCEFGAANCVLWDIRYIVPLTADGMRLYWMEVRSFNNNGLTEDTPTTSLIRFYDYEPLSDAVVAAKPRNVLPVSGAKTRELTRGPQLR
ncbi:MAG: carboxypeptidase-like regulatory domain-containing protein [Steroidobacter sp.]